MVSKAKLLVLALLLVASAVAFGQSISGDIVGTVVDKTGAMVPGATVTALHTATGVKSTATTNTSGEYRFGNLPIGNYEITAMAKGFATSTIKGVIVELNKTLTVKVTVDVASTSTKIEVTEAAAAIDTATAQLQSTYDTQLVQDMPTTSSGSGVLNLSLLQAGVGSANGVGAGAGPSVGGQRPRNNNFTVEGVDNNDKGVTGPLIAVPADAVSEFTLLTNQYSPEFGHSTGGQFNTVLVNGTNTFHGRAYEYFQNRNLNAVDAQYSEARGQDGKIPRYDNNRFGGQIGGPIIKNKLFFFFNYQYQPIGTAGTPGSLTIPTAAGYATLLGIPGVSAANINGLKSFATAPAADSTMTLCVAPAGKDCNAKKFLADGVTPNPVYQAPNIEAGSLGVVGPSFQNTKTLVSSVDWNVSTNDQVRARYIWNKTTQIDTAASLPQFFTNLVFPGDMIALSEYHTFTPNLNNELRVGYLRSAGNWSVPSGSLGKYLGLDAFPNVTIDETGLNLGPDPNAPQYNTQNLYQITDNVTFVKRDHTFKFGGEYRKSISPQLFIQRSRGDYDWSTLEGYAYDTAPDGIAQRSLGNAGYSGDQWSLYWFANDQWKVNPHLTLNLGVRYEYTSTPYGWTQQKLNSIADVPGLITFASPAAPKGDFMPRLGFAYSPGTSGNTSIRGGFGMGYDVLYDNIGLLATMPEVGATTVDCTGLLPGDAAVTGCPDMSKGGFLAQGGIKPFAGSGTQTLTRAEAIAATAAKLPNDVKYPYSIQWNLGIQHVIHNDYTLEVRYVGTRGVHLNVQDQLNKQPKVSPSMFLPTYLSQPSQSTLDASTVTLAQINAQPNVIPAFHAAGFNSTITSYQPLGSSIYHGLQTQLDRRFANGLQFRVAWTWSHNIDNSTADFFSTVYTPRRPGDIRNINADRSNSALSRAHRITVQAIYETPWYKNSKNWFAKNLAGNWQITPVFTYESGEWADVQSGVDSNLNGDSAGDRAIYNAKGQKGVGSGISNLCNSGFLTSQYYLYQTAHGKPTACGGSVTTNLLDSQGNPIVYTTTAYQVGYLAANPNARYIRAGLGALSTDGRNTLLTPGIRNLDISLVKRFNFTERIRLEYAFQALNALNHPQFVVNNINDVASGGSTATSVRNMLIPTSSDFNKPQNVLNSNARACLMYLKVIF